MEQLLANPAVFAHFVDREVEGLIRLVERTLAENAKSSKRKPPKSVRPKGQGMRAGVGV